MTQQRKVVIKPIVSPNGTMIADIQSIIEMSVDGETETNQRISVKISSRNNSSNYVKSSSSSSLSSCSSGVSIVN